MQKQLASERSEPSGGLGKGKGRRLFPSEVTRSARLARYFFFFTLNPVFCFLSHQGACSQARGRIKQKGGQKQLMQRQKKILKKNSCLYRIQIFYLCNQSATPVSVNGSNPVRARIISGFLLLHLYPQRSSLHLM